MFESTTTTSTSHTATAMSLHRLSRQSLQSRYESEEEEVSESDTGANDFTPSLTSSPQRASHFDSDASADEAGHEDLDLTPREMFPPLGCGAKRQRPVSLDTVKRNSVPSFSEHAYIFDPEKSVILGLPSSDNQEDLLDTSLYLQPTVYVAPDVSPRAKNVRSRSASPASIFSIDYAEIQTAKKITLTEPTARPSLVFINSLGPRIKHARSRTRKTSRDRESRILDGKLLDNAPDPSGSTGIKPSSISPITESIEPASPKDVASPFMSNLSRVEQTRSDNDQTPPPSQSATIQSVSEIPTIPILPLSPHMRSQSMHRLRPRTAGDDSCSSPIPSPRSRRPTEPGLRPPSIRSNSNSSVPSFGSRPASPFFSDLNYIRDHSFSDAGSIISRTCSPLSCASSPPPPPFYQLPTQPSKRGHTGSKSSVSSLFAQRSPSSNA
ncbi:hypothetical protein POX_a00125 [Penicillium oxalicum]|uniref:hypothetical protein n=1 Tax=Penicillium oxalicum TaxID=69781 RepID=UPI0020B7EE7A|nr:hypothetical protein POX_a00125 [Penicillium oxalicum]KAI2793545.1 hypothetical protein POX_a00125 [Penicillium oxalicum]